MISNDKLKSILEALLFSHPQVMSLQRLASAFPSENRPDRDCLRAALEDLAEDYQTRAVQLQEVAGGFRFQTAEKYAPWLQSLLMEKPTKYSRATLETLALIIYRQPITRAEIEEIRGVAVSSHIIKTLEERGWIRVVGHREVPGRPALLATTRQFLDDFNLKHLSDLPSLEAILALDEVESKIAQQLELSPEELYQEQSEVVTQDSNDQSHTTESAIEASAANEAVAMNDQAENAEPYAEQQLTAPSEYTAKEHSTVETTNE